MMLLCWAFDLFRSSNRLCVLFCLTCWRWWKVRVDDFRELIGGQVAGMEQIRQH
jgi:hypothetical protein